MRLARENAITSARLVFSMASLALAASAEMSCGMRPSPKPMRVSISPSRSVIFPSAVAMHSVRQKTW